MIKNENYITVQGWMATDLHLSGNDLLAYAIIYGFSQGGMGTYNGSQSYIAEWCNISRESANRILKRLENQGLITCDAPRKGFAKNYKAVPPEDVTKHHKGCDKTSQGGVTKHHKGCDKTSHNNNYYNNNKNIYKRKRNSFDTAESQIYDISAIERATIN